MFFTIKWYMHTEVLQRFMEMELKYFCFRTNLEICAYFFYNMHFPLSFWVYVCVLFCLNPEMTEEIKPCLQTKCNCQEKNQLFFNRSLPHFVGTWKTASSLSDQCPEWAESNGKARVTTSEFERGLILPCFRHHFPSCLQDKLTIDKFADAADVEGNLRMNDGEMLV